jgi:quinohemoprotein amine dehydrogenase
VATPEPALPKNAPAWRDSRGPLLCSLLFAVFLSASFGTTLGQTLEQTLGQPRQTAAAAVPDEAGIPITDPLVIAKCGACHASDGHGNIERISTARTTPEGWQDVLRRMVLVKGMSLTPPEARTIVKYLSTHLGLAPEEAKPVMYDAERRIHDESDVANQKLVDACTKCHTFARALSWRRTAGEWKQFLEGHAERYKIPPHEGAVAFFARAAPLITPEWTAWSNRTRTQNLAGRWLVTATVNGRDKYYGEMVIEAAGTDDEFKTRVNLRSVKDGSALIREGRSALYDGYAWRGRSKGGVSASPAPDDPASEVREVMWFASDQSKAEGRWFWGQYQEFGFDVRLQRAVPGDPRLLGIDRTALKTGSQGDRLRLIGDNFPGEVTPADVNLGPGVTVRRIISHSATEIALEVDVSAGALSGRRDVAFRHSAIEGALAIYDRIDYIKATPESTLAAFGGPGQPRGYQQFEAIGYQRGPDGKRHTPDDVQLGPVDVTWSIEIFYATADTKTDMVGNVSSTGFFTPAAESPKNNFDVWVIAQAIGEKDADGKPLVGKAYLVVTVPFYTFNGRRYVRDLERWVDDGPVRAGQ